jgi:hypothetical protein
MQLRETEYAPFYSGYIKNITTEIMEELKLQVTTFPDFLKSIPVEKSHFAYAEDKWSILEVIGHILDVERVMAYRALCFARHSSVDQPGFDENIYAKSAHYNQRTLESLSDEFILLRKSNLLLFESFSSENLQNMGIANGKSISVRALLHITGGHLIHHKNILEERYLI